MSFEAAAPQHSLTGSEEVTVPNTPLLQATLQLKREEMELCRIRTAMTDLVGHSRTQVLRVRQAQNQVNRLLEADCSSSRVFTNREKQVADYLLQGKCNKEIAQALCISVRTVKFHCSSIYVKLGVQTRYAVIVKLLGLGTDIDRNQV